MEKSKISKVGILILSIIVVFFGLRFGLFKEGNTNQNSVSVKTTTVNNNSSKSFNNRDASKDVDKVVGFKNIDVKKDGYYTKKDEVASYIVKFSKLPNNYIRKREAMNKGWDASSGNLWSVTDKKSIGGDYFLNSEGLLPKKSGRKYYEADIDYNGGSRNAKRIVYSDDGLIYYTDNHYESFERLK